MRVAVYYRVSTDAQDFASQKTRISAWIAALPTPPTSIVEIEDHGISGKTNNRPGYQRIMALAEAHEIDTVVVYRLDRFSRSSTTAIMAILTLNALGVGFIAIDQPLINFTDSNPFKNTFLALFADMAQIEREAIVARVNAGLDAARRRGVRLGRPVTKDVQSMRPRALELRAQRLTFAEIAKRLDICPASVSKLLTKPAA